MVFQNINLIFVFNMYSKHRKYFYSNKLYILYLSFISFLTIYLFTSIKNIPIFNKKAVTNLVNYQKIDNIQNELNKIYLFLFILFNFLITLFIEKICNKLPEENSDIKKNIQIVATDVKQRLQIN